MWKWRNMCGVRRYDNLSMLLWIHWKYLPGKWVRKSFSSYSRGMNLLLLTPLKPNYRFQWQWYFYEYKTLVFTVYIIMYTNQIIDLKGQFTFWASDFTCSFTWLLTTFVVNKPAKFGHSFSATYWTCTNYTRYFKFALVYKCYFPFAVSDSKRLRFKNVWAEE